MCTMGRGRVCRGRGRTFFDERRLSTRGRSPDPCGGVEPPPYLAHWAKYGDRRATHMWIWGLLVGCRPRAAERAQRIMEPYFPRGTSSTRWVIGVGCRSKANIPHCPLRLRAHSSHCHWQQGTKCSVRGGDAEITMSGRRAGICDLRVFASKVASKRSRHSAHPPSIGKLPSIIRW
jgi:hypothetical protein